MRKQEDNTLYEQIMESLAPIVKNKLRLSMGLNEMSDELLNRAIVSAVDRDELDRARRFSEWKRSDRRKEIVGNTFAPGKNYDLHDDAIEWLRSHGINSTNKLRSLPIETYDEMIDEDDPGQTVTNDILRYLWYNFHDDHLDDIEL